MVWSVFLFTDYLSVTWLAQCTRDVIEWLLQTFRSWREGEGGMFVTGNNSFVQKSASMEQVVFYYRFLVSCLFLHTTRLIEIEAWKSFYSFLLAHPVCGRSWLCSDLRGCHIICKERLSENMKALSYLHCRPILFTCYLFWLWGEDVPSCGLFWAHYPLFGRQTNEFLILGK